MLRADRSTAVIFSHVLLLISYLHKKKKKVEESIQNGPELISLVFSPLDETIQLVLAVFEEGGTLSQHAADVVHLHGQHLIHVLLLDAHLTDELHHPPTFF